MNKDLCIVSSFSNRAKRNFILLNIISILLYVGGAFAFFNALYMICNMIGSIVSGTPKAAIHELVRVLPILVCEFSFIYLAAFMHNWTAPKSIVKFQKNVKKNGIITLVIGAFNVIYIIVGLICGLYHSLVEGYPTALFPLNLLLTGILFIAIGILLLVKTNKFNLDLPVNYYHSNVGFGILKTIYYMASLFAFAALIYSTYVVDWEHGHIFYSIMLVIILLLTILMTLSYKFIYCVLIGKTKVKFELLASIIFLVTNIIVFILYIVAFSNDLAAPSDAWYGILCVDFTASFNAITYIYGGILIITPIVTLIHSLVKRMQINK